MAHTQSQQAYGQTTGSTATNFNWLDTRDPSNTTDTNFPIGTFWQNTSVPKLWYLNSKSMVGGVLSATWELISVASVLVSLSDTSNTVVLPSLPTATPPDNIQLVGGTGISIVSTPASNLITISNTGAGSDFIPDTGTSPVTGGTITITSSSILSTGTLSNALRSNGTGASTLAYQTQYAGGNPAVSTGSNWGVAQFDTNSFGVSSGFVTLKNGGTTGAVTKIGSDDGGTTLPSAAGSIGVRGKAVTNGSYAKPLFTTANPANEVGWNIQVATTLDTTDATLTKVGLSVFNSAQFTVDANGFVGLAGGTGAAVTNIIGDDALSIVPNGSGAITFNGTVVTNATGVTNGKPIYFKKSSTNVEALDVQLATTSTSGAKNINKSGLAHFDSASFTIDAATGFVSLTAGGTDIQTITGNDSVAVVPTAGNVNVVGTGSITTSGSGSTETIQLTGLTNHAVLVGAGSATITKIAATANTGAILQNNSGTDPSYSTATYPSTTTINQILYSSSANTVIGLATANSSSLVTSATGVPTWLGPMTNGQLIIGSTGSIPVASTLTAGSGVSITNGAGSITIAATGTGDVQGLTVDATSGGGTNPVVPDGSGHISLIGGATFSTGSRAFPIEVVSTAANTASLQIQLAGSNPTSATTNDFGVSQFESTNFNVSAGFVKSNAITLTAGSGITLSAGSVNLGGSLTISSTGSSILSYKNINHGSSPYTVLSTDQYLSCDSSGGAITLNFANAPTTAQVWYVKDRTASASANNISITTPGGTDTIDGLTTYKITSNYGSISIIFNGTNYEVF